MNIYNAQGALFSFPQNLQAIVPSQISLSHTATEIPTWAELTSNPGFGMTHTNVRRQSAVAFIFIPGDDQDRYARLLLTRRTSRVNSHKGQVSFAGGRREPEDLTPVDTALRELNEELGVNVDQVSVLGMAPSVVSIDRSFVFPVVLSADIRLDSLRPAPEEVAQIYAIPWTEVTADACQRFCFVLFGIPRWSFYYATSGPGIWGLTAEILARSTLQRD